MNKKEAREIEIPVPSRNKGRITEFQFIGQTVIVNVFNDGILQFRDITDRKNNLRQLFSANGKFKWHVSNTDEEIWKNPEILNTDYACSREVIVKAAETLGVNADLKRNNESAKSLVPLLMTVQIQNKNRLIAARARLVEKKVQFITAEVPLDEKDLMKCIRGQMSVDRFFYKSKNKEILTGECSDCLSKYSISLKEMERFDPEDEKSHLQFRCPKCGKLLQPENLNRFKTGVKFFRHGHMFYGRKSGTKLIFNRFEVVRTFDKNKPGCMEFSTFPLNNHVVVDMKENTVTVYSNTNYNGWIEKPLRQKDNPFAFSSGTIMASGWSNIYLYCDMDNFTSTLDVPMFSALGSYLKEKRSKELTMKPNDIVWYLSNYIYIPGTRLLYKRKASAFLEEHYFDRKDQKKETHELLNVDKSAQDFIIKQNMSIEEIGIYNLYQDFGWKFGQREIAVLRELAPERHIISKIKELIVEGEISLPKLKTYLRDVQKVYGGNVDHHMTILRDTLSMRKKLKKDFLNKKLNVPIARDLYNVHDDYVLEMNRVSDKVEDLMMVETNRKIQERFKELNEVYTDKSDRFILFPVPDFKFLRDEGRLQKQCVKNYAERYGAGNCDILVVRDLSDVKRSVLTVEIREKRVIQARGYNNHLERTIEKDALGYLKKYCDKKNIKYSERIMLGA